MSRRRCGVPTEDGTPCRNPVVNQRYCGKHPGGRSTYQAPRQTSSVRRVTPQAQVPTQAVATTNSFTESWKTSFAAYQKAVGFADDLIIKGWRETYIDKLSEKLGDDLWSTLDHSWKPKHCRKLAAVARRIEQGVTYDSKVLDRLRKGSALQERLAAQMIANMQNSLTQLGTIAMALRGAGIVMCMANSKVASCACLKDLAEGYGPALSQSIVHGICMQAVSGQSSAH